MKLMHNYQPSNLVSDNEFDTNAFGQLLQEKNIHHILTNANTPAHTKTAVVERAISTLKNRIQRYLTANETRAFRRVLQKIVLSYNEARHSSIGVSPLCNETSFRLSCKKA